MLATYKGRVASKDMLPSSSNVVGDTWIVGDTPRGLDHRARSGSGRLDRPVRARTPMQGKHKRMSIDILSPDPVPFERDEQRVFVNWLKLNDLPPLLARLTQGFDSQLWRL